jgi:hypothetical protein
MKFGGLYGPEIIKFVCLDGPGGPRDHSTRRGASCPALWSGFGAGRKSSILVGLGGPGGPKNRSRRWGGFDPQHLDWSWGPPKFKKSTISSRPTNHVSKHPRVDLDPGPGSSSAHGIGKRYNPNFVLV